MSSVQDKKKILVVDDEKSYVEMARIILEQAGYEISHCYDGQSAVERARMVKPDLILLDITMPGLDGIQVCEALKLNEETAGIPVIMCTARKDSDAWLKSLDKGASRYISKPYESEKLIEVVKHAIDPG